MEQKTREELVALLKNNTSLMNLSSAQQRLLFVQILENDNSFYNNFAVFRVDNIEYDYFQQAINVIVSQSVLLRSKILDISGKSYFYEVKDFKPAIDKNDFTNQGKEKLDQAINETIRKVFPTNKAGMYKIAFYKYGEEHYLVFNFHHIIIDGWSLGLFFSALTKYYSLLSNNQAIRVEDYVLRDNFANYANEEKKDFLKYETFRMNYWKKELEDFNDFEFPLDKMRPNKNQYIGKKKQLVIEGSTYHQFVNICKENRITVFSGLMTVFYMLLAKYTKQYDITIGTAHANRLSADFEKTIGTFLNTVPVRINIEDENINFVKCAKMIQKTLLQDQINQLPFDKLVESLNLKRDLSKNALFQILFIFQNMQLSMPQFDGSNTEYLAEYHNNSSRMDLELHIWEKENKFVVYLFYNSELFFEETIDLLLEHFQSLFRIVNEPERPISEILLPPVDIDSILNPKMTDEHKKCDICKGFDEVVAKTPDKIAVVFQQQHITYSALGNLIDYYEKNILSLNLGKNYLIGIYMERSIEMVAMIHAILRSGCGYAAIERSLPLDRILDIIHDTQIQYIYHNLKENDTGLCEIADNCDVKFMSIYDMKDCSSCHTERVTENDLAYIIYTSGSTGKTKGVMLTRENLQHYLYSFKKVVPEEGTWLAVTNYNFDLSVAELIWTLYYGNRVILTLGNSKQFLTENNASKLIKNCHITHMQMVPTLSRLVFDTSEPQNLDTVECVILGGEFSTKTLLDIIHTKSSAKILNMYGPTETTVFTTYSEVSPENETDVLGNLLENVSARILDDKKRPVPQNVPGELYLAGPCVSKGYINRKELTEEKFSIIDGVRYYQTGDVCKIDSHDQFIILGRNDRQIKLNGFRIEIDEIENDILKHPEVKECNVQLCGDKELELVAFISVSDYAKRQKYGEEINSFLKRKLPFYMIPSKYLFLEVLPKNANGKTDVKKLKAYYLKERDSYPSDSFQTLNKPDKKRIGDTKQWIYSSRYEISEPVEVWKPEIMDELAILFVDTITPQLDNVITRIKKIYKDVVTVDKMASFKMTASDEYGLNIRSLEDYRMFYEHIIKKNKESISIFNLWGINDNQNFEADRFNQIVLDYFYFFKSLNILDKENIKVAILDINGVDIYSNYQFNYNNSFLQVACNCFGHENTSIYCAYLDFDESVLQNQDNVFESVIHNFACKVYKDYIVRQVHYYHVVFEQVKLNRIQTKIEPVKQSVYIIFGGLRGIGLEMAYFLSGKASFNFVLAGRSDFPSRSEWEKVLNENLSENRKWIESIKKILMIESNGSKVIVKQSDVTKIQELVNLQHELQHMQLSVKGIVYSAGKGNSGYLNSMNEDDIMSVLQAKTSGAYNVWKIFGEQIDFMITNSSLASILGGIATYDYSAANAGLDSYVKYLNCEGCSVFNFNWDTWKEVGMAHDISIEASEKYNVDSEKLVKDGITNKEAHELFELLFSAVFDANISNKQFLVSFYPLEERYKDRFGMPIFDPSLILQSQNSEYLHLLDTAENGQYSTMSKIKAIWSSVLHRSDISENDNFFDIGGNSILLMRVQSMMKKAICKDITINILYNYPTINSFCEFMEKQKIGEMNVEEYSSVDKGAGRKRLGKRLQRMKNDEQ